MHGLQTALKIIFCLLFSTLAAHAEVLRWPQVCAQGELQITNTNSENLKVWLQTFTPNLEFETEILLQAHAVSTIPLKQFDASTRFSLLHFYENASVKAVFNCQGKTYPAHSLEGGILTFKKSDLSENKLWVQNLFSGENKFQIEFLNKKMQSLETQSFTLHALQQFSFKQQRPVTNWVYLKISAKNRYAAFNLNSQGSAALPFAITVQKSTLESMGHYFLVAPRDSLSESFIVKISDPEMVKRARELVANPALEKMLFAKIEKGDQGFNRNWSKKDKSFWSWSATEVTNFADLGSTACNGAPQIVEDRLESWVKDPGRICFWNYRIKKELSSQEVSGND
jgi:hypothetical protein